MAKVKLAYLRPQDGDIAAYLDGLPNFSDWVRSRALAEMGSSIDPALAAMIERLLEMKLAGRTVATDHGNMIMDIPAGIEGFF